MTPAARVSQDPAAPAQSPATPVDWKEALGPWRRAGVLHPVDVQIAAALARLCGLRAADLDAVVATALAARAPRHGHVCLDLATVRESAPAEVEGTRDERHLDAIEGLPWPSDTDRWRDALEASPLTAPAEGAPLVLDGDRLYLERYWVLEARLADEVLRRATAPEPTPSTPTDPDRRAQVLDALLPGESSGDQRDAALHGLRTPLSVVVGGPGTGKTRTVGALLAVLLDERPDHRVAMAAPTGKAAARMGESIQRVASELRELDLDEGGLSDRLAATPASTVHRLLGARPGGRFRHDAARPLPVDTVIVDETSMMSLPLMVALFDAVPPQASVVLLGDPGQLASVEAGSVLGDIAGPVVDHGRTAGPLADIVHVLRGSHRFPAASPTGRFADAVRRGDADAAVAVLAAGPSAPGIALRWAPHPADTEAGSEAVRGCVLGAARTTRELAEQGDADAALSSLGVVRLLCAHRTGPFGVAWWNHRVERWLADDGPVPQGSYPGRPVLVTTNDPAQRLFNGDLGVVVAGDGARWVAFPGEDGARRIAPSRLDAVETAHALTIHKSQGSEFDEVVVVLPPADSRLATRELLYTAVTRARRTVTVVGDEASLRAAVGRRVVRASGLRDRLWPR
ncbi:MAG: exodeoxyribonuclease V subunit alpha [Acidimicrobiales bacterium]|jgi:exodeoxyribonuclease V alpha subunit|nr:exodeoxyribonuclease V subunit alpha [Acidimicrobiales bacterium]